MKPELPALNFPSLEVPVKIIQNRPHLFDPIRKINIRLTPEEWVRQHCLAYLLRIKGYPAHRILVERELRLFGTRKRFDLMVMGRQGDSYLLAECKAPEVEINQQTLDQAGRYNLALDAPLLWLTNGLDHYIYSLGSEAGEFTRLSDVPEIPAEC